MTIQEAIEKAYKEGFVYEHHECSFQKEEYEHYLLRPLFWQSLGKAMGWGYTFLRDPCEVFSQEEWKDKWHDFIDYIAEGGTPESFFDTLTNSIKQ